MSPLITLSEFTQLYEGNEEFAVVDPREELMFARGHLFAATNMPLSRMEMLVGAGIPLKSTLIVICDDGDGLAQRAAAVLSGLEYSAIRILEGGLPAWELSGGAIFTGVNVPSKAFGEMVERELATPGITAAELHEKIARSDDFILLDARPMAEHQDYCIPGSVSCPSVEMALRATELHADPGKEIVVHCAGRTRAIIGAQTLVETGAFRSVRALENGTPAWEFLGLTVERGNENEAPLPDHASPRAQAAANRIRARWNIPALDAAGLKAWRSNDGTRYIIDVRGAEEFAAGHVPGALHVAGGQLLQTTEKHLPVKNSHIVLTDSDGARAVTTAMWLRRMGWKNVSTYQIDADVGGLEIPQNGAFDTLVDDLVSQAEALSMHKLGTATFCDLRPSYVYRRGHIAGSAFLTRANLETDAAALDAGKPVILVADDVRYADLVMRDLRKMGRTVRVLQGGFQAWQADRSPTESGLGWLLSRPIDVYLDPEHFDELDIRIRENHAYLNWEVALIDHIVGDPALQFDFSA